MLSNFTVAYACLDVDRRQCYEAASASSTMQCRRLRLETCPANIAGYMYVIRLVALVPERSSDVSSRLSHHANFVPPVAAGTPATSNEILCQLSSPSSELNVYSCSHDKHPMRKFCHPTCQLTKWLYTSLLASAVRGVCRRKRGGSHHVQIPRNARQETSLSSKDTYAVGKHVPAL